MLSGYIEQQQVNLTSDQLLGVRRQLSTSDRRQHRRQLARQGPARRRGRGLRSRRNVPTSGSFVQLKPEMQKIENFRNTVQQIVVM